MNYVNIGLMHYGVPHGKGPSGRGSGRYPWGSGKEPFQGKYDKDKAYEVRKSYDQCRKADYLSEKWLSDKDLREKYIQKAHEEYYKIYNGDFADPYSEKDKKISLEWYRDEVDGQSEEFSSFRTYLKDSLKTDIAYRNYCRNVEEKQMAFRESMDKLIDTIKDKKIKPKYNFQGYNEIENALNKAGDPYNYMHWWIL